MLLSKKLTSRLSRLGSWASLQYTLTRDLGAVRFIQIGSNDGRVGDPLKHFIFNLGWRGILVEPVPHIFHRLCKTYEKIPDLIFEQAAIAPTPGVMPFYYVQEPSSAEAEKLPSWYNQIGSFDKSHLLKHADRIPGLERLIGTMDVPCITFSDLCAKHGVTSLDVLHTDTEGFDIQILSTIDFARWRPKIIFFESEHASPDTLKTFLKHLKSFGYEHVIGERDTVCLHRGWWRLRAWRTSVKWLLFVCASRLLPAEQ